MTAAMKMLGIVGGTAPESTIEYYRLIVAAYRHRAGDGSYPSLLINSIDLKHMLALIAGDRLAEVTRFLLAEVERLARAGAEFGLLASNTPHIVFDDLRRQSPIPLISIVETACDAARALGLTRVGLIGTRFTMQGHFYAEVFAPRGIALCVPASPDREYIHDKYMGELVNGIFRPDTRDAVFAIVERLRTAEGIQGVILAGTELPLLLGDGAGRGIPFLDTTRLHVERAVAAMFA
ncbi:MAG: amino acid racemase [Candidatus Rokubacteria bacterium]|nr:amino acid racemase [Candidatus Rokubacteria bacterium]